MIGFVRRFVVPIARRFGWKSILEIGASTGESSDVLLKLSLSSYTIIDPCFDCDLKGKYADDTRVNVLKCNSLDALAIGGVLCAGSTFNCILIDGDHNWYTVFNELRLIRERRLLRPGGYIFLDDVGWPYGRRDMYYQPDTIPAEFRKPFAQKGMVRRQSALSENGGFNPDRMNACEEGGERNGVLAAVQDFLAQNPSDYRFCLVHIGYGFGMLQLRSGGSLSDFSFLWQRSKAFAYESVGRPALALMRALKL